MSETYGSLSSTCGDFLSGIHIFWDEKKYKEWPPPIFGRWFVAWLHAQQFANYIQSAKRFGKNSKKEKKELYHFVESSDKALCDTILEVNISENPEKSNMSNSRELLRIIFAFDLLLGALTLHLGQYNGKISEKHSEMSWYRMCSVMWIPWIQDNM